jgi:acetolactate synthase-1/2/3 large subunit
VATGAERVIKTAMAAGARLCFANPGTTEMPVVQALDSMGMPAVLGLHENVCTGAADGFGRLARDPALVLLHLGPGTANGVANLHNARRARSPVVLLVGEHATWHMSADAPLAMDIEQLAGTFSRWVGRVARPEDAVPMTLEAVQAARHANGGIATLILPHDLQLMESPDGTPALRAVPPSTVDYGAVAAAAELLQGHGRHALFLGGPALWGEGLRLAGRIAARIGCALVGEVGFARMETGQGLPVVQRLPYFPEAAQALLDGFSSVVGIGAKNPVSFFGWPGQPSRYLKGRDGVVWLTGQDDDTIGALRALADALDAHTDFVPGTQEPIDLPSGGLDATKLGSVLAAAIPERAIVVPTAVTSAYPFSQVASRARPHTEIALTGGAIGEGPALSIGAALAAPDRKVINLEADGSAAYAMQAFWTQAREGLDITTIICANRSYRILRLELERAGITEPGKTALDLTDLGRPKIDWVGIAAAQGVPGARASTVEEMQQALGQALAERRPFLIEAEI